MGDIIEIFSESNPTLFYIKIIFFFLVIYAIFIKTFFLFF